MVQEWASVAGGGDGVKDFDRDETRRRERFGAVRWTALDAAFVGAANARIAPEESARAATPLWQRRAALTFSLLVALGVAYAPGVTLSAALALLALLIAATALLRALALLGALASFRPARGAGGGATALDPAAAPPLGIVIALRDEGATLPVLLEALARQSYPKDRLRVVFALEDEDRATAEALAALYADRNAPDWLEVATLAPSGPKTKPRALNAAWAHLENGPQPPEIIGILDAEDRPEPELLARAVETLASASPRTACAQARLGYYNARENWLSRCFAIEYASWFDVMLTGLRAIGAPIPLGGTSVFFRCSALQAVGGWDAFNVTEDADLGMRLAAAGYACALVDATTQEEAACRVGAWVRQRSRWLKGYLQTWLSISRRPLRTALRMGPLRYLAAQALLLGAPISALAQPLVIGSAAAALWVWLGSGPAGLEAAGGDGAGGSGWVGALGTAAGTAASALATGAAWAWLNTWVNTWATALGPLAPLVLGALVAGQAVLMLSALIGLGRTRQLGLAPWILTLPLYWPLAALAAYKAVFELFVAPFYWDKTRHGVGRIAARERRASLAARDGLAETAPYEASSGSSSPARSRL
ncbi:MAG: glycosyltransferase family 2 protein [Pseudomonadota bacterium]